MNYRFLRHRVTSFIILLVGVSVFIAPSPIRASTNMYSNPGLIAIPENGDTFQASPYPSEITVSAAGNFILDVNVYVYGLSHSWARDIDMLLVGPSGQNVVLMSDVGENAVSDVDLVFDQSSPNVISRTDQLLSGTYRPSNDAANDNFDPVSGPYGNSLVVFNGTNPNGTWRLYIIDDAFIDMGEISGGWALEITTRSISITDVSRTEGDNGTSSFTFSVNLDAPAPATGVIFDITTSDGTATVADNDYVPVSLQGQVIPSGQWSYQFHVLVNGDSRFESDETFSVNITNVTGVAVNDGSAVGTILNDDAAGITINPTSGLTTTEAGGTDSFSVVLTSQPTADVVIALTSSNTGEGTVSPASLTFTSANWNISQTAVVTGVDDGIADGDVPYTILTSVTSMDTVYAAIDPADVDVTNTDDDAAGITISPTSGLMTTEAGGTDSFSVVLNSQPTADVTITLTSSNTGEGTVSPAFLTFTSANWNVAQIVTVTGVDDAVADGDAAYTIQTSVTSSDADYAAIDPDDISVTNDDDDAADVTIAPASLTMPEGASGTYQIRLASLPSSPVTVNISFDATEVTLNGSSASPLVVTFNGSTTQTISVASVLNDAQNTGRTTTLSHAIVSGPAEYPTGMALPSVTVQIDDVPPPPPTPLCEDHNFAEGGVVRASTVDGIDTAVNCRVLYQNGAPTQWLGSDLYHAGNLGVPGLLELGVVQAVDIFSPGGMTYFNGGAVFCLRGSGTLIWLAASGIPRHPEIVASYSVSEFPGFTCITLFEPGTLMLVRDNPIQQ